MEKIYKNTQIINLPAIHLHWSVIGQILIALEISRFWLSYALGMLTTSLVRYLTYVPQCLLSYLDILITSIYSYSYN